MSLLLAVARTSSEMPTVTAVGEKQDTRVPMISAATRGVSVSHLLPLANSYSGGGETRHGGVDDFGCDTRREGVSLTSCLLSTVTEWWGSNKTRACTMHMILAVARGVSASCLLPLANR